MQIRVINFVHPEYKELLSSLLREDGCFACPKLISKRMHFDSL